MPCDERPLTTTVAFVGGLALMSGLVCCSVHAPARRVSVIQPVRSRSIAPSAGPSVTAPSVIAQKCRIDGLAPSRRAFLTEVLFAEPTTRTRRFDDYTTDSYHVRKLDLVTGLEEQSRLCGLRLRAVLIVGPVGMLWSYHIAALTDEGDHVRVNTLVMPHARITGKGSGVVPPALAAELLAAVAASPLIRPGIPTPLATDDDGDSEFSYQLLLVVLDGPNAGRFHASFNDIFPKSEDKDLLDRVNRVLGHTSKTYPKDK